MSAQRLVLLTILVSPHLLACSDDDPGNQPMFSTGNGSAGDESSTGDETGDGGNTTGDGDGDGDPTTGDGDGDGDPTTGDGDGDGAACGWDGGGYYCGGQGADPDGQHPYACPPDLFVEGPCGSVTDIGCCDANGDNWWCSGGLVYVEPC